MISQREAVYIVKNALSGSGAISDDSQYSSRRLLSRIKGILSQLKHRNLAKNMDFDAESIQVLDCISMVELDRVSCPSIPPSGLTWLRSQTAVPQFIKLISVTDILGQTSLPVVMWNTITAHLHSRVKAVANSPVCTFRNTDEGVFLYALTPNKVLSATMVASNPAEAYLFPRCGEVTKKKCDYWELPIGSSEALLGEAIQFLVAEELKINASVRPDQIANDNPS